VSESSYRPYRPAKRPGGRPRQRPVFRVLVHRQHHDRWVALADRVGLESPQQFWDHVAFTPDRPPAINSATVLRGRAGRPEEEGFSNTIHFEISSMARIDYQYCHQYRTDPQGDSHAVVRIRAIQFTSH
jgi:hypothetical protein